MTTHLIGGKLEEIKEMGGHQMKELMELRQRVVNSEYIELEVKFALLSRIEALLQAEVES